MRLLGVCLRRKSFLSSLKFESDPTGKRLMRKFTGVSLFEVTNFKLVEKLLI